MGAEEIDDVAEEDEEDESPPLRVILDTVTTGAPWGSRQVSVASKVPAFVVSFSERDFRALVSFITSIPD